jgi:hypothetical protein
MRAHGLGTWLAGALLCLASASCVMVSGLDEMQKVDPTLEASSLEDAGASLRDAAGAQHDAGASRDTTDAAASPRDAGDIALDASPSCDGGACDATIGDTGPLEATFTLGATDCNGGRCEGGYNGAKDVKLLPTATEQCVVRGYLKATDFTIGGEPGGLFCVYVPANATYGCDPSCSGCDVMKTVTCIK